MLRRLLRWCAIGMFAVAMAAAQSRQIPHTSLVTANLIRVAPSAAALDMAWSRPSDSEKPQCAEVDLRDEVHSAPQSSDSHYQLGLALVQQKQLKAAVEQFRAALKYKPDLVRARNALGSALLDLGCNDQAEDEFREVLKADPESLYAIDHLGQVLASDRRYTAAVAYWKRALSIKPDSPDITRALAIALYNDGKPQEAIDTLMSLTKAHPDMKSAHFALAGVYAHQKRYREAATEYKLVIQIDPKDNEALLARIRALIDGLAYQDALQPAQEYTRLNPGDPKGHLLLGSIYVELGDQGTGEEELTRAASAMPDSATAQYELGLALARDHKPAQALPHLEKALALDPHDTLTQYQLAHVLRALGDNERSSRVLEQYQQAKEQDSSAQTNQANALLQSGQPAKAAEIYRQILAADPQDARTEYNLALALGALQDREGERRALEKAASLDPNLATAKFKLGTLDLNDGKITSAQQWLKAAVAADPQLAPAKEALGVVYAQLGDEKKAEKMFREIIEDAPDYPQAHLDLGVLLARHGEFEASEAELDKAASLAPTNAQVLSAAANVKQRMGKMRAASSLLRNVVLLEPESVDAHLDLAIVLAEGYDLLGALEEAHRAVRLGPDSAVAHFNRGRVLFYLGRNQEARLDFETACGLAPQMAEPYYFLALAERQVGDYSRAIASLQEVVNLQPKNEMAWSVLGDGLEHEARHKEAVAAWRHAITINPEDTRSLGSLAVALRPSEPAEAARLEAQISAVEKEKNISGRAQALASEAIVSMQADDWPDAIQYLQDAMRICRQCAIEAELHKSLGLIHCDLGDLDHGEAELRAARALKPRDPQIDRALAQISQVRADYSSSGLSASPR